MNEEEKKARAFLRFYVSDIKDEYFDRDYHIDKNFAETILNLIEKQQKEIQELKHFKEEVIDIIKYADDTAEPTYWNIRKLLGLGE